ncbi:alpha/beta fold hydrolase [Modestobacter sp. VKM Ac-2985]|uniref:alpha/beta fold hydrolase n=1 Tax=Modestobacter sp. VKM Ac-2985 TaxID=3004139 RepID=UPI0022AB50FD|nr:alpha/beta hydrolase [Modestobacter sp. VKM Ac-2985]MCZ2840019.1 alpha/beta hydrolase [Modestobacter sp. VKM Ac-2985]
MSSLEANGVPVAVCVPGLGLDERSWARVRRRARVVVVRLPGMGTQGPVGPLEDLTDQLLAALGPGRCVLVAHSQSCQVAVAAAERDARVVGVVLLGPATDPATRRMRVLAGRWVRTAIREQWWQVPVVVAQWLRTGPRDMVALWRRTVHDRIDERLRRVVVPVLVVRGQHDALCPTDWAAHLAAAAPRGRLVELPGAAHMTPQTRPDDVAGLLTGLIAEVTEEQAG